MNQTAERIEEETVQELRALAASFPSQGGAEIGPWLERYAAQVPPGAAIVEVGCWFGAGTAHLALGALENPAKPEIHVFDRFRANDEEVGKAAKFGLWLKAGQDTLPLVRSSLGRFAARIHFHKSDIRAIFWPPQPIALYVDDASKAEVLWNYAMSVFRPHFVPGAILVLMDYHFDEKAGEKYAAQKRYMARHEGEFELIEERMAGTTAAVFKHLK